MDLSGRQDALEQELRQALARGERVRWQGKGLARVNFALFATYLFAIPWTAFSLFWTAMAWGATKADNLGDAGALAWAFPLFGLPFILVGLGMMAAPFLPLWTGARTIFAITDHRVIRLRSGRQLDSDSVPLERVGQLKRKQGRDGSGTLSFPVSISRDSDGDQTTDYFVLGPVAQIGAVEDALRQARDWAKLNSSASSRSAERGK